MSILGKILAIVNIFAILGTLALLSMNYVKRQNWEYAVFRQDLMINGLPIDGTETDSLQQTIVSKIGAQTKQDLFKQVASPNEQVTTQADEVTRVKGQLDAGIRAAGDKKKQIAVLATILKPMADTIEQRTRMVAYQTYLRDDQTFAVLKTRLQNAHKAATAPQQGKAKPYEERFRESLALTFSDPPGPFGDELITAMKAEPKPDFDKALEQSLDAQLTRLQSQFEEMFRTATSTSDAIATRKRAIARLLFNMIEVLPPPGGNAALDLVSNPAYKRFFIVVGVKAALEAVNDQANILQSLVFETGAERQRERYLFAEEHRKLVDLVLEKKTEIDEHKALLAQKKKEAENHATQLRSRRQDVKVYEEQLATERRNTIKHLQQLRQVSDQLFTERVKLRENSDDNQRLEKQIRSLEEGR